MAPTFGDDTDALAKARITYEREKAGTAYTRGGTERQAFLRKLGFECKSLYSLRFLSDPLLNNTNVVCSPKAKQGS